MDQTRPDDSDDGSHQGPKLPEISPEAGEAFFSRLQEHVRVFIHPDGVSPPILATDLRGIAHKLQRVDPSRYYFHSLDYPLDESHDDRTYGLCPSREECEMMLDGITRYSEELAAQYEAGFEKGIQIMEAIQKWTEGRALHREDPPDIKETFARIIEERRQNPDISRSINLLFATKSWLESALQHTFATLSLSTVRLEDEDGELDPEGAGAALNMDFKPLDEEDLGSL